MPDVKKKPRKISCLPCRNKKARCDVQYPHCSRCIRNNRVHLCIYPKPRTFGRPPKNAANQKKKDIANDASSEPSSSLSPTLDSTEITQCRELVPGNRNTRSEGSLEQCSNLHVPQRLIKYNDQILDIERIFSLYVTRGMALRDKLTDYESTPQLKLQISGQVYTWHIASMVNITIKRSCQSINIRSFFDPELSVYAFIKTEHIHAFFFKSIDSQPTSFDSPLESISTDEALKLIDNFFQMHPYHILLNKTKLLQGFWDGSVDPLLLCVIYGISTFINQQAAGNTRGTDRNPFLDYAYVLMEELFSKREGTSPASLGNYQASVILGIFEILFGLSKHGMTIISLSYMLAADLGIFTCDTRILDDALVSSSSEKRNKPKAIDSFDPVDKELLINTYWAALRVTAYGCLELGLYLRDSLLYHGHPFPAASAHTSASYQYDYANNNHSPLSPSQIEMFHTEMVITYFSSKLFACIPRSKYNLFGCYTDLPPENNIMQDHRVLLQLLQAGNFSSFPFGSVVDSKTQVVLNDFSNFIMQERHQWSFQQCYTIETAYYLYCIHFSFSKPINEVDPIRYHQMSELDLTNPQVAARIANLQPTTLILINLLQNFLIEIEENDIHGTTEEYIIGGKNTLTERLPFGVMTTALETMVELTIYHYKLGISPAIIYDQIRSVYTLIKHPLFWIPRQQQATKVIHKNLRDFLRDNQIPVNKRDTPPPGDIMALSTSLFLPQTQSNEFDSIPLNTEPLFSFPSDPDEFFLLQDFNELFDGIC